MLDHNPRVVNGSGQETGSGGRDVGLGHPIVSCSVLAGMAEPALFFLLVRGSHRLHGFGLLLWSGGRFNAGLLVTARRLLRSLELP